MIYRVHNRFPADVVTKETGGSLPVAAGRTLDETADAASHTLGETGDRTGHSIDETGKEGDLRKAGWFTRLPGRQFLSWALQQLNVQPYQHLLEIGYGAGLLTAEVARALRIGFIAGIEHSIPLYRQAYRRNKRFVHQQLLQLHVGQSYELPYPAHYFHTVYGVNIHLSCANLNSEILRLTSLLKNRGRMVLLLEKGRRAADVNAMAARLKKEYHQAGLTSIHIERQPLAAGNGLAVIGYKD